MPNLVPDLITDILGRLPVKSLLRFRCVSKPWCSQIDGPDFIKLHLNHSLKTNTNFSLIVRDSKIYIVDLDSPTNAIELDHPLKNSTSKTEILGSCNGLLALLNSNYNVALYNPSTRKYHKLPVTPNDFPGDICLAQYSFYGFGHDPINDDYKVVRMVQFYGDVDDDDGGLFYSEVKVYSLKTNSWKKVFAFPYLRFIEQPDYCTRYKGGYGVYACGALHWKAPRKPQMNDTDLIVAFDLGVEEFRLVSLPDYGDFDCEMNVGVLGGSLCVLCNYDDLQVDIWVMKEYGVKESWTKMFWVITELQVQRFYVYVRPLVYSKSGDKVLLELDNRFFAWYDLKRRKGKTVKINGVPNEFEVEICVGSLVPLNGRGRIDRKEQHMKVEMKKKKNTKKRDDFLSQGFKLVL